MSVLRCNPTAACNMIAQHLQIYNDHPKGKVVSTGRRNTLSRGKRWSVGRPPECLLLSTDIAIMGTSMVANEGFQLLISKLPML
jgi:hypothetical protein